MNGRIKRPDTQRNTLGMPIIGTVKCGMKAMSKTGKEYPTSVDYFIPSGKYAPLFTKAYGEKPQTIQIVFPSDDASMVCNERYEYRSDDGKLIASGDGEKFLVWNGKKYAEFLLSEHPDLMQRISAKNPKKNVKEGTDGWDITLTLIFRLPMVRGVAGLWRFITKGTASTIPQIRDAFDRMQQSNGHCESVIWDLSVKFAKSQKPGVTSRYPVVTMVANESEENLRMIQEAYKPINLKQLSE